MELIISGLKCDHCDYRDDSVQFSEYKESIGKPCPKCGNSLLTQEEYDNCLKYYKGVNVYNKIGNVLKWFNPFHYWRLIFGDRRLEHSMTIKYPNRKPKL